MSKMVMIHVDGNVLEAERGAWLLRSLLKAGYDVPNLCDIEALIPYAACRLCLVEVEIRGRRRLVTACDHPVMPDMNVLLDTERVLKERRTVFEVLLSQAPESGKLRQYAKKYGVQSTSFKVQEGSCILCGLCERVCKEIIGTDAIDFAGRGANRVLTTPFEEENPKCIGDGSCARVCPTECIKIVDKGLVREMPQIHARHELVPCRVCGEATLTRPHACWLSEKTKIPEADLYICDRCKAKQTAQRCESIM